MACASGLYYTFVVIDYMQIRCRFTYHDVEQMYMYLDQASSGTPITSWTESEGSSHYLEDLRPFMKQGTCSKNTCMRLCR